MSEELVLNNNPTPLPADIYNINDVNINLYKYFGVDPINADDMQMKQLKRIQKWAFTNNPSMDEAVKRIASLDMTLGMNGDSLNKVHSYVVLSEIAK